jgi:hypothetical protein
MFNIIDEINMTHLLLTCRRLLNSFGIDFRMFCFWHGRGDFKYIVCLLPLDPLHLLEFGSSWSSLLLNISFWCFLFKVALWVCIWKYWDQYWIMINEWLLQKKI